MNILQEQDEHFMREALALAARARGRTSPNPMVGSVVVKDGRIVGRGFHEKAGAPHGEVVALQDAGAQAKGATLYVTLEPCCHYGRTPPCTKTVIAAGVRRVVAAMRDPNPLVSGKGAEALHQAGIDVTLGVLEDEATTLNEVYIKYIITKRPFVFLKVAASLDGKIATVTGESRWITNERSRLLVHQLRDAVDAVMVGINTVLRDDPWLTTRLPDGLGKDPIRIVVDSHLRTPLTAKLLTASPSARAIIATTAAAPRDKRRQLEARGAEVMVIDGEGPGVPLGPLMEQLGAMQVTSILLEGGGELHGAALRAGIVDKVLYFLAPKLIGGRTAPTAIAGEGFARLAEAVTLQRVQVRQLDGDLLIEGYVGRG
ncbi:MAG TPA: bifunctional diaminohydroxyphosphoribosylaminopyrimidine deaminase/5-amino-6-(5-phosphoribosylamino)uracil reductase RibD [Alphaproteobacteria bacterium]|nr:bifunctional diaminohydroxyphosphoribosylaminopyrimidine deaminase/5-amino-6-(5-phosphoribosylamino)uracil reductase RibD [Alphaproteobacteria bacterium]